MKGTILILILLLTSFIHSYPCVIYTSNGKAIDLSGIDTSILGHVINDRKDPNFTFYFNICNRVDRPNYSVCPTNAQGYQYSKVYNLCFPLGRATAPGLSFISPADESAGVKIAYPYYVDSDGVRRSLVINLRCDRLSHNIRNLEYEGESKESGVIVITFSADSRDACVKRNWWDLVTMSKQ